MWPLCYVPALQVHTLPASVQQSHYHQPQHGFQTLPASYLGDGRHRTLYGFRIAKKDIYHVKSQRLMLAQDEYNHLNNALATLATSRTSLCSSASGVSTKYDPDLLKSDVALAKNRVSRLKSELEQIRNEMTYTQKGVDTLTNVEQKLNSHQGYNIVEAQAIMAELVNIQKSLSSGEKEKAELMQSLAKLKDDLTRLQLSEGSPDISTLSLPQEKLSTASQTDLSCELVPIGTRLAEMAKMRLEYDEARKQVQHIQQKLADLEEKVQPGQVESDKDRLLLFQEKEQLLRELRSITPRMRSKEEMSGIQLECKRLEQDLNKALEMSNRAIADRLRLHEEKQLLLQQLRDALRQMTHLESHLKTLSASTLSVSSSSSLGSLSTTSSKGSLSSGLSFTDIYGGPQCSGGPNLDKPIDMVDLHRRVERVLKVKYSTPSPCRSQPSLSPRSSLSSVSPPVSPMYENLPCTVPPPTYEQVERDRQVQRLIEELGHQQEPQNPGPGKLSRYSYESSGDAPLSPISETPPPMIDHDEMLQGTALSRTSSSGTNTRSVSAAVSDESVAGDSGVFEASNRKKLSGLTPPEQDTETAQIQIKLRYVATENILNICVERARNLGALYISENAQVYIKIALLPSIPPLPSVYCTKPVKDLKKPSFGDIFNISVPVNKIYTKTLQLNVWSKTEEQEKCVGCTQVSLADFNIQHVSQKWYNILSLQLIDTREDPKTCHNRQESDISRYESIDASNKQPVLKEESSDDSTIISSQTSTLTRNQDPLNFLSTVNFTLEDIYNCMDRESDDGEESEEEIEDEEEEEDVEVLEVLDEEVELFSDKQTNTECAFYPEHAKQMKIAAAAGIALDDRGVIKRSQTFSPSAHVNKNQYICKLNRSDSDSAMPLYRRGNKPFERNAIERRSLRFRRQSVAARPQTHLPTTARTSLDLELDLQAQHTRLDLLHSELLRLRELKAKLEGAKERGDTELATYLLEDERFQNLLAHAETFRCPKTPEEKKVEKMLRKVSKEIYKLRKTKAGNGKPDIISFKEKMAFFTRVNTNVPFLPSDECHSDVSKVKDEQNTDSSEVKARDVEHDSNAQANKESAGRYEYVVDRVLGVEV
ncbi:Myosin tail 1, APG6, and/or AAA 27 domain containing protein [Asbolus verrucosus]|uniref:Myosin tail 1, APG6, and/or AAA 27 domain containing protein n=1 Tax=Asbolus verrucosus TaxID=1661398 RepID=A0A482VZP4_ASBVE|nr:Myosin tail 1, APG6, and/or AAA 27 domain containing protein [Asbolus verrucosus]